jgi:hypothetical protein
MLQNTFLFREQFYFVVSVFKIMGHGNPDNNLESHCAVCLLKGAPTPLLCLVVELLARIQGVPGSNIGLIDQCFLVLTFFNTF